MKTKATKVCTKCGQSKGLSEFYYHRRRKRYMETCKSCSSRVCGAYQRESGFRDRPEYVFYQRAYELKRRNAQTRVEVMANVKEHLLLLWKEGQGRCHYTGREMSLRGYGKVPNAMTVDRIDPAKGYIPGNIVLCCAIVNRVKQDLSIQQLVSLIDEIKAHTKGG